MARKEIITHEFTSDLSGVALENDGWSSVKFTVTVDDQPQMGGMADLSIDERETFLALIAPYFEAAKRAGNYAEGRAKAASNSTGHDSLQIIRNWAFSVTPEVGKDDDGKPRFADYVTTMGDKQYTLERPSIQGRLAQTWKDAYAQHLAEVKRQDAEQAAKNEGHASEATINAAIAAGEQSVQDATPAFSDAKPAAKPAKK